MNPDPSQGPAETPPVGPAPPAIPGHVLVRAVGGGAFGTVWLALDELGHWVAVKVVSRPPGRPGGFEQEYCGLVRFEARSPGHPGLVRIRAVGFDAAAGRLHYSMDAADDASTGRPLPEVDPSDARRVAAVAAAYQPDTLARRMASRGRFPPDEATGIGIALADALAHLHAHDLLHRDVKPSNVVFVRGRPRLADFGLVAAMDATQVSLAGTPGYVPVLGWGDPSGDVYALGRVLYQAGTGRGLDEWPAPPPDLDRMPDAERVALLELQAAFDRACEAEPSRRQRGAAVLRDELELARERQLLRLRSEEEEAAHLRVASIRRRRRLRRVGLVLAAVLAVAALAWGRERGRRDVAAARLEQGQLTRLGQRWSGWSRRDLARAARSGTGPEAVRHAVFTLAGPDAFREASSAAGPVAWAASSPDGLRAATVPPDGTRVEIHEWGRPPRAWAVDHAGPVGWTAAGAPWVLRVDGGEFSRAVEGGPMPGRVARLVDGGRVARGPRGPVVAASHDGTRWAAAVERGGSSGLAAWRDDGRVAAGERGCGPVATIGFSPDGEWIAAGGRDGVTRILRADTLEPAGELPGPAGGGPVRALAFGADARLRAPGEASGCPWLVAVADGAAGIAVWDAASARPVSFCHGSPWETGALAFLPDGATLASAGRLGVRFWDLRAGVQILATGEPGGRARALAPSADGTRLLVCADRDGTASDVESWRLERDRGIRRLRGLSGMVRRLAFSADGRRVAALTDEWRAAVWDAADGRLVRLADVPGGLYADGAGLALDGTGRLLFVASRARASVVDVDAGAELVAADLPDGWANAAWSTGGGEFRWARIEAGPDGPTWTLRRAAAGTVAVVARRAADGSVPLNLAASPTGNGFAEYAGPPGGGIASLRWIDPSGAREAWRREVGPGVGWAVPVVGAGGDLVAARLRADGPVDLLSARDGTTLGRPERCRVPGPGAGAGWHVMDVHPEDGDSAERSIAYATYFELGPFPDGGPALPVGGDGVLVHDSILPGPGGRWVAWGCEDGTVSLADLDAVRARVGRFRRRDWSVP